MDRPGLNCLSSSKSIDVSVTGDKADSATSYKLKIVKIIVSLDDDARDLIPLITLSKYPRSSEGNTSKHH